MSTTSTPKDYVPVAVTGPNGDERILRSGLGSLGNLSTMPAINTLELGGQVTPTVPSATHDSHLPGKLLVLLNPGKFTRHYLQDMVAGAHELGIETVTYELGEIWQLGKHDRQNCDSAFLQMLQAHRVRAVLGSGLNGVWEWPVHLDDAGRQVPFFEHAGIPHLMWWTDHPQWASKRHAMRNDLEPLLRSPNNHHFMKSELKAEEIATFLHWPNCHGLPVAENPKTLKPAIDVRQDFDVVAIVGSPPQPDVALAKFVEQDDPDVDGIDDIICERIRQQLSALWANQVPSALRPALEAMGRDWTQCKRTLPDEGTFRAYQAITPAHCVATDWLARHPNLYFDALHVLWGFGRWQRTFILMYLAKYFKVGVLGSDWSSVGIGGGNDGNVWIDHADQPRAYARGRIALNVPQAGDEEGLSHKPFQIAASGVAQLHSYRRGLEDCFALGDEIATFRTPREAREVVAELLDNSDRRAQIAKAGRARVCSTHTWPRRLEQMFALSGVDFGVPASKT